MGRKSSRGKGSKKLYSYHAGGYRASFKHRFYRREAFILVLEDFFKKQEEEEEEEEDGADKEGAEEGEGEEDDKGGGGGPLKHEAATEETITTVHPRFLSFLEKDDSFLCPSNGRPNASHDKASREKTMQKKQYMQFQPGSFFSSEDYLTERQYEDIEQKSLKSCWQTDWLLSPFLVSRNFLLST